MKRQYSRRRDERFEVTDAVILAVLLIGVLCIVVPFINVVALSFTSYQEAMETKFILWPKSPTLDSYQELFKNNRVLVGYKTTLLYLLIGVPLNLFLEVTLSYGLSKPGWPGRKFVFYFVLLTMVFNGGVVPTYLVMKSLHLNGTIWAVIFANGFNTFNMILIYNYIGSIPASLMESSLLDGANEWQTLAKIVIPLLKPILATVILFTTVQLWNEYFYSMLFLRSNQWQSLQQVLRSIIIEAQTPDTQTAMAAMSERHLSDGIKMATVVATIVPILCVYPFMQRYFTKGIMIGAVKA